MIGDPEAAATPGEDVPSAGEAAATAAVGAAAAAARVPATAAPRPSSLAFMRRMLSATEALRVCSGATG